MINPVQDWNRVERRKMRPTRESNIDLLEHFGTGYPEPENTADELRKHYYDLLARPWVQRGKGLSHNAVVAISILVVCLLLFAGGIPLIAFIQNGKTGEIGVILLSSLALIVYAIVICGLMVYVLAILNINKRTRANTFRKYPLVRRAARQLADTSKEEAVRDYIPVLKINGGSLFYIAYCKKGDTTNLPTGILILDDQGRVILQYDALEKAKLTAFLGITCGHVIQQRAEIVRRSMKNVVGRQIPDAVGVLRNHERQFSDRGLSFQWASVMEGAAVLPQALRESMTIFEGEAAFRNAMGYAFALEFQYEDALKLRELNLSYVRYMNSAYRRKIISLINDAAMLIQLIQPKTDWQDRNAVLAALSTLTVAGTNGVLSRICQKEYDGILNDEERKVNQEKTQQAKNMGWPVISD